MFIIQVPSHSVYYTGVVKQYVLYSCRHSMFKIFAVTQCSFHWSRHTVFTTQVPSHSV